MLPSMSSYASQIFFGGGYRLLTLFAFIRVAQLARQQSHSVVYLFS
jgi:hypothetical protein